MSSAGDGPGKGFRMNQIPSIFGREISYATNNDGNHVIVFVIFPCEDLFIHNNVELEVVFPPNFQTCSGEVSIRAKNAEAFSDYPLLCSAANSITFPWLEDATKYPISVWFYALRQLLKKQKRSVWKTPVLIKSSFQDGRDEAVSNGQITLMKAPAPLEGQPTRPVPSPLVFLSGAGRTKGRRNYMEDVDFIFESVRVTDKRSVGVYGVLDGHGGKECAIFAAEEIPVKIAGALRSGRSCPEALFQSFIDTDVEFLRTSSGNPSGSTANVMLWDSTTGFAYVANTADTRAVLCRCGTALDLSIDRKASDPEEIARIAESGGFVANGRVQGSLAVSRALGDAKLKVLGSGAAAAAVGRNLLIPDPEVTTFRPCGAIDDFIIIATDGLWDVMTSQAAVDYVSENLIRSGILPARQGQEEDKNSFDIKAPNREMIVDRLCSIAHSLADHAIDPLRSLDNVTVMIVLITDPSQPWGQRCNGPVMDSYWQVSDGTDCSGDEGRTVNERGRDGGRERGSDDGGAYKSASKQSDSLDIHRDTKGVSSGERGRLNAESGLINRLNSVSLSDRTSSASDSSSHSDASHSYATGGREVKSGHLIDAKSSSSTNNSSERNSHSSNDKKHDRDSSRGDPKEGRNKEKEKKKDDDDLMDFLLDDSNF